MEPLNFIYWLQGYLELQNPARIDTKQIRIIQDRLKQVLPKAPDTFAWVYKSKEESVDRVLCEYPLDLLAPEKDE